MDSSNVASYVALLEQHIYHLQCIMQQWKPYVPEIVIQESQTWRTILPRPSLHLPSSSSPNHPVPLNRQHSLPEPAKPEKWRKHLQTFIDKIPTAEKWSERVIVPSVSTLDVILQRETIPASTNTRGLTARHEIPNILPIVERYALFTESCAKNARQGKLIAAFLKFLFCTLCHVACCVGADPKDVNKAMGIISKGSTTHLDELRHGVVWGSEAIDRLHARGKWGIRSGDILFHFPPSLENLRMWAKASQSMEIFTDQLKDKRYTEGQDNSPSINISVPCIIKCLFGKAVRLSDICTSLRCNVSIARQIFLRWYLKPYGSNAMDDMEARTLYSPIMQSLPAQENHYSSSESDTDLTSAQGVCERPRKRLRTGDDSFTRPTTVSIVSTSSPRINGSASLGTGDKVQGTPVHHGRANKDDSVRDATSGFSMSDQVHSVEFSPDGDQGQTSETTYPENIQFFDNQVRSSPIDQPSSDKLGPLSDALGSEATLNIHSQGADQDYLEPDPAIDRTLFNSFDGDPAISQTLFSRVESDPSIEGALFTRFDSDPAITRALFSRGLTAL